MAACCILYPQKNIRLIGNIWKQNDFEHKKTLMILKIIRVFRICSRLF